MLDLMTVQEAAELLGIHKVSVYQAIRDGRLPCVTVFGRKVVSRSDVLAYKARTEEIGPKGGRPHRQKAPETGAKNPVGRPRKHPRPEESKEKRPPGRPRKKSEGKGSK